MSSNKKELKKWKVFLKYNSLKKENNYKKIFYPKPNQMIVRDLFFPPTDDHITTPPLNQLPFYLCCSPRVPPFWMVYPAWAPPVSPLLAHPSRHPHPSLPSFPLSADPKPVPQPAGPNPFFNFFFSLFFYPIFFILYWYVNNYFFLYFYDK